MQLVSDAEFADYRNLMRDAHDTFHQKEIFWKRLISDRDRWGEDDPTPTWIVIPLLVLCNYNYMRSWPITQRTETGEIDRQSIQILINKDYLRDQGFIAAEGYFIYDPSQDLFEIDGLTYEPSGDTPVGQAHDDDIDITIIVKAQELSTGQNRT